MIVESGDIAEIIAATIGALGAIIAAVLAAWLRRIPAENRKRRKRLRNWAIVISVLAIAGIGYWVWSLSQTRIMITYPSNGARVELTETISGRSSNIRPTQEAIWVVIYSYPDNKLYPNESKARIDADGKWTSLNTEIGALEDQGQKFDVIAFLVNEDGQKELEEYFSFTGRSGLAQLPGGTTEYNRITVTRK